MALILAAGESQRLGHPKQILPYGNTTLLNHLKKQLNPEIVERTYIVLGAYVKEIVDKAELKPPEYFEFKGWQEGMGSSLAFGCKSILEVQNCDGILITLSDLPLVSASDYRAMTTLFSNPSDIVATESNGILGVPAIFGSDYFKELKQLKGEKGAKPLIQKHKDNVLVYKNDHASTDIDTPVDYDRFKHLFQGNQ